MKFELDNVDDFAAKAKEYKIAETGMKIIYQEERIGDDSLRLVAGIMLSTGQQISIGTKQISISLFHYSVIGEQTFNLKTEKPDQLNKLIEEKIKNVAAEIHRAYPGLVIFRGKIVME
jgi:hypothetical protein